MTIITMPEETSRQLTLDTIRQPFWSMAPDDALATLVCGPSGLTDSAAEKRRGVYGSNEVRLRTRLTKLRIACVQFSSPLILILVAAGAVTAFLGDWVDTAVIAAAVFVNVALGFWQENKAEHVLELLRGYIRTNVRVRRNGSERELDASVLVPGDIIRVTQGDRVPADARILFANALEVNESVLTGESLAEHKYRESVPISTPLADRVSMLFGGTMVVQGFGDAVVTATGPHAEFGKIASLVAEREREETPLQRAISRFAIRASLVLALLTGALFAIGLSFGESAYEMFFVAVAVAVSAVPEGLPVALTVILAVGVQRLAARRGIVRKLLAAETMGSVTMILTDKTGTLTQARMSLESVIPFGGGGAAVEEGILTHAVLNTDVVLENPDDPPGGWRLHGHPLEVSLVIGAAARGVLLPKETAAATVVDRVPFSSGHKFSVGVSRRGNRRLLTLLGAPEVLLGFSDMDEENRAAVLKELNQRAYAGERVIGVASRELTPRERAIPENLRFKGLSFEGLIAFRDPLRPGVADAIARIGRSGVKTVIVTGDHRGTAESVARELGLINEEGAVLTGEDMRNLSEEELAGHADRVRVYARITPEQKVQLAKMYKAKGEVVAMTGDGINDAPAIQAADIGVAVGSGTDVTKSAADLVILDDNFETIVAAIEEGRRILGNIRKVVIYLLSDSLDEILLIGGTLLLGRGDIAIPLTALQILFVNFFSDSFPAVALAFEKGIGEEEGPRRIDRNLFDHEMRFLIVVIGVATSLFLFALYLWLLAVGFDPHMVQSFIFASFATYTLFLVFPIRSLRSAVFRYNPFSNPYATAGVLIGVGLTALAVYAPFFQRVLGTVSLPAAWAGGVLVVGVFNILAIEFGKWLLRRRMV